MLIFVKNHQGISSRCSTDLVENLSACQHSIESLVGYSELSLGGDRSLLSIHESVPAIKGMLAVIVASLSFSLFFFQSRCWRASVNFFLLQALKHVIDGSRYAGEKKGRGEEV